MKRSLVFLVQVGLAAGAGYVAWRLAAHRLHVSGNLSLAIGLFAFAAGLYGVAAFRRGIGAGFLSLLPIAGAALLCVLAVILARLLHRIGGFAIDNPALAAAWIIVLTGAVVSIRGATARR